VLILALDTTTRGGSAALVRDGDVLGVVSGDPARTHAERLPEALVRVLEDRHETMAAVDLFAVAAGPGSFTGLRIGIATIQGLAFALGRPVVGVSVLDALAQIGRDAGAARGTPFVGAWMDAQRNEVFAALYPSDPHSPLVDGPVSEAPASVLDRWQSLTNGRPISVAGDGVTRYRELLAERLGDRFRPVEPLPPLAPTIARIAAREAVAGHAVAPHAIRPIYVRRPDAELARDKKR
jgi:tRNA threonylcarbamoyladenosine biosynthesis protein TsaB